MSVKELNALKSTLLSDSPTSQNAQFQQRWERAYTAIESALTGKINARRFRWQIGLSILILVIGPDMAAIFCETAGKKLW